MKVKLLVGHTPDCLAVKSHPEDPWWMTGESEYRDAIGRKGSGSRRWLVLECNSPEQYGCRARAIVLERSITEDAQALIAEVAPGGTPRQ